MPLRGCATGCSDAGGRRGAKNAEVDLEITANVYRFDDAQRRINRLRALAESWLNEGLAPAHKGERP